MIVEDDSLIQQLYAEFLKKKGYDVIAVASDGAKAVSIYERLKDKPDVVILDFRLPTKNGLEVSKEIMAYNNQTDILMISGDPTFDKQAVLSKGIYLMQKPVELNEIIQGIISIGNI